MDDLKALAKRSKMREEEMTSFVNDIEEQHGKFMRNVTHTVPRTDHFK